MIGSRALSALALLLACTRSTELLPPAVDAAGDHSEVIDSSPPIDLTFSTESPDSEPIPRYDFCPTVIDVYGAANFLFPGCGGPQGAPADVATGLLGSDDPNYPLTLAGRLTAKLATDSDLVQAFGSAWTVRSCAGPKETLAQLTPTLDADNCGADSPSTDGQYLATCTANPAPVMLLAANMLDDRCHGGGLDSDQAEDEATYESHFQARLQTLLSDRAPRAALVGNRTEWTDAPGVFPPDPGSCWWQRPEWDERALTNWSPDTVVGTEVTVVGDRNPEFKQHHLCYHELGIPCSRSDWFAPGSDELSTVNCFGAQAIVDFWYKALKSWLLSHDFDCPLILN